MQPASIRYKNPGAMWGSSLARKWGALPKAVSLNDGTGQGNNIAVFPTYVQGICAQLDLWRTSANYRNKRFAAAIRIWSGGNHVESYIKFVTDRVPGMTRDTIMDDAFWRSPMGIAFLKAQAWHEAGKRYPAPDADWIEAQRRVFAGAPIKVPAPTVTKEGVTKAVIAAGEATGIKHGVDEGWGLFEWSMFGLGSVLFCAAVYLAWHYAWPRLKVWWMRPKACHDVLLEAPEEVEEPPSSKRAPKPVTTKRRAPRKPAVKPKSKRKSAKKPAKQKAA